MKSKIVLITLFMFLSIISYGKDKIKIGYFNNVPHISLDSKKHTGFLVDYWEKLIVSEMDVDVEWVGPLPPARLFVMLEAGEINCIALLSKNPDREKKYDYPDTPFQPVKSGIAVLKDGAIKSIESAENLSKLNITFFKDGYIPNSLKTVDIKWDFLATTDWKNQGLMKLKAKRVDGVFDPDASTLRHAISENKELSVLLTTIEIPNTDSANYSVFSKKDNGKFLKRYNTVNNKILQNDKNAYLKLLNKE